MVTGASTADVALILIDARKGVLEQSRRHAFLASLLGIPHLVLCVNKMDLVDWSEERFEEIKDEFRSFAMKLDVHDLTFIPVSALLGDNIVDRSANMPWYEGGALLHHLEEVHIASDRNLIDARFPVQYVIRPQNQTDLEIHDYRGYAGQVAGGVFRPGDEVVVLPSGFTSTIASIDTADGPIDEAYAPMSVTLRLADEIDISRGDMIARPQEPAPRRPGRRGDGVLDVREHLAPRGEQARHQAHHPVGAGAGEGPPVPARHQHAAPQRGRRRPGAQRDRPGHPAHHAAALLRRVPPQPHHGQLHPGGRELEHHGGRRHDPRPRVTADRRRRDQRERHLAPRRRRRGRTARRSAPPIWFTGLSGSGKSTVAAACEERLVAFQRPAYVLDGDNVRLGLNGDLGFSAADRAENVRRVGHVARLMADAGIVALVPLISPYRADRDLVRALHVAAELPFLEVFVDTPIELCEQRDPKGLYAKARAGRDHRVHRHRRPLRGPAGRRARAAPRRRRRRRHGRSGPRPHRLTRGPTG